MKPLRVMSSRRVGRVYSFRLPPRTYALFASHPNEDFSIRNRSLHFGNTFILRAQDCLLLLFSGLFLLLLLLGLLECRVLLCRVRGAFPGL